jgi:hypothetical protein
MSPSDEMLYPGKQSCEDIEMRNIRSLTSGMTRRQIPHSITSDEMKVQIEQYGETNIKLGKISCIYNPKDLCEHLVLAVNIATTYRDDINWWENEQKVSSIVMNDRHSKFMAEELARKWNIGIQTAKDTIQVTTQRGI